MKKREHWADIAKGIGIILVILGHIKYTDTLLVQWLYTFHMPLFFFISGYFINKNKTLMQNIKHKAYILLVPYLLLSIIYFLLEDFFLIIENYFFNRLFSIKIANVPCYFTLQHILGLITQNPYPNKYETLFWFFGCLFITSVIMLILVYIFKENKYKILISSTVLMVIGTILINVLGIRLIWNADIALIMVFFASLGYWTKKSKILYKYSSKKIIYKILSIIACGIIGIIFMILTSTGEHIDYYTRNINNPIICYSLAVINIMFIIFLSEFIAEYLEKLKLKTKKLELISSEDIEFLGRNSAVYYVFSPLGIHIGYITIFIIERLLNLNLNSKIIYTLIVFFIAIIIPRPIIILLNKFFPKIFRQ